MVRLLVEYQADVDSQDNRKVSCLMAAFRKVHTHIHVYMCIVGGLYLEHFETCFYLCICLSFVILGHV